MRSAICEVQNAKCDMRSAKICTTTANNRPLLFVASQFAVSGFLDSKGDEAKFAWAFQNRISYMKSIHQDVKTWVSENIEKWRIEEEEWFSIEQLPDEFLPLNVLREEGGASRRRSSVSFKEVVGTVVTNNTETKSKVHPEPSRATEQPLIAVNESLIRKKINEDWKNIAEDIYATRSNNYKSNYIHVTRAFEENAELFAPLLEQCPKFKVILSYILEDRLGWRVQKVDWTRKPRDWSGEDCRRVGCSLTTFIRKRKTGDAALSAWHLHYAQLSNLKEIEGFETFMLVFTNNMLRDSIYGMVVRVSVGAALSILDAVTDIYVISKYYNEGLRGQANAMLAMIATNTFCQIIVVLAQYKKKNWKVKVKEVLICLFFLRPAVDAYRVSTNYKDSEATVDPLVEMIFNKVRMRC